MASEKPADVQYLVDAVGLALQKGLAEVMLKKPQDPVEYLANWLYSYCGITRAVRQDLQEELVIIAKANAKEKEKFESELLVIERNQVHEDEAGIVAAASQKHAEEQQHVANADADKGHHEQSQGLSGNVVDLNTDRTDQSHDGAMMEAEAEVENVQPNADEQDTVEKQPVADGGEPETNAEAQPDESNQAAGADEGKPRDETEQERVAELTQDAEREDGNALDTARSDNPNAKHGDPPAEENVEGQVQEQLDAKPGEEQPGLNVDNDVDDHVKTAEEAPQETVRSDQDQDQQEQPAIATATARSDLVTDEKPQEHSEQPADADEPQATERSEGEVPADAEQPPIDVAAEDTQETVRSASDD